MSNLQNKPNSVIQEKEVNFLELALKIWAGRRFIIKVCGIALILGIIVAISIPKEYTTSVTMAPEISSKSGVGNLGMLASMAGINLSGGSGSEALSPDLYPDIVKSTPFIVDLLAVKVNPEKGDQSYSLYEYMEKHQRKSWWSAIPSFPVKAVGKIASLFSQTENKPLEAKIQTSNLTEEQTLILNSVSDRILVGVNKKSGVLSLSVTMQDPFVAASITDTVMVHLQTYITGYRTNKAKHDLDYTEKLYQESKAEYYAAQQRYASFEDGNRDIISSGYRTRLERLQNETTLAYGLYNQISQQLQLAKAKVQEVTPIFTVIQPAIVPLKASEPNKPMILVGFLFLAFVFSVGWILVGKEKSRKYLK